MGIGVVLVELVHLMVGIGDDHVVLNFVKAQRLELDPHEWPEDVLQEDLVDVDIDRFPGRQLTSDEVFR